MRKLFLSKKALIPAFIIAALYMVFVTYLMNASLVKDTLIGSYPLSYKWNLLTALLGGMWTAMSGMTLILLIVSAILTGFNLILITKRIGALRSSGKVQFLAGGGSLLGIIGSAVARLAVCRFCLSWDSAGALPFCRFRALSYPGWLLSYCRYPYTF